MSSPPYGWLRAASGNIGALQFWVELKHVDSSGAENRKTVALGVGHCQLVELSTAGVVKVIGRIKGRGRASKQLPS